LRTDVISSVCPIRHIGNGGRSRRTQGWKQGSWGRRVECRSRCNLRISSLCCIGRHACRSSWEIADFVGLAEVVCEPDGSWTVLVREQRGSVCVLHTVLVFLATSLGHATPEIIKEFFVLADTFDVDRIAAAKAGSYTCAGAIR
jgi:hypothetical protein